MDFPKILKILHNTVRGFIPLSVDYAPDVWPFDPSIKHKSHKWSVVGLCMHYSKCKSNARMLVLLHAGMIVVYSD